MRSFLKPISCILLLVLLGASAARSASASKKSQKAASSSNLVEISCAEARYPSLCLRTLSAYASTAKTPSTLARAAVSVALRRARDAADFLAGPVDARSGGGGKRGRGALQDCVEQMGDSVDELSQSLGELKRLRPGTFRFQMSNVETWVSAALTNEDTCLDGFQEVAGDRKAAVKKKIQNVARVTSNALYLIDRLADSRP